MNLIRPVVTGNTGIPAVWTGNVDAKGAFNYSKLNSAWDVKPQLDALRRR